MVIAYLIIISAYLILLYSYRGVLLYNTDVAFLVNRANNMLECISDGNVPWFYYNDLYGVGYGSSFFYGQLTLYPFLPLLNISEQCFVWGYILTALVVEFVGVRELCKRFTKNYDFITLVYFCCSLAVFHIGVFKMFPNILGVGIGYLFLAFCVDFFRDGKSFIPASIMFFLLLNTHLITAVVCFVGCIAIFIYYKGYKHIGNVLKFSGLTVLLCSYNIANFIYHMGSLADTGMINRKILSNQSYLNAYTLERFPFGDIARYIITGKYNGLSLCSFVLCILIIVLLIRNYKKYSVKLKIVLFLCITGIVAGIRDVWSYINQNIYTPRLQFPIRYLPFILLVILLIAFGGKLSHELKLYTLCYSVIYFGVLVSILFGFTNGTNLPSNVNTMEGMIGNGEYLSKNFCCNEYELIELSDKLYDCNGNEYLFTDEKGVVSFDISANEDLVITVPKLYYKGYVAEVNGKSIDIKEGYSQFVSVYIKEGTTGTVHIFYKQNTLLVLLEILCLGLFTTLSFIYIKHFINRRKKRC